MPTGVLYNGSRCFVTETKETNYAIVSQNALGMMGRRNCRAPLNVLYYPYIISPILYN
jgi:hypothetical protein